MFMEHLALTYKCHSSIGNSLDLKEMLDEVLATFIEETNALNGYFYLLDEDKKLYKYIEYKNDEAFNVNDYYEHIDSFGLQDKTNNEEEEVLIIPLKKGIFFLLYKKDGFDFDFIGSMFQDLIVKLNISIDACLSVQILKKRNSTLDHLASELKKQKKELIESDKYKSNFLANMSHELKTPLNSVIVISSIMAKNKKNKLDEEQVKNMKIINNCGNDLLVLINDILDISKIEAGEISINLSKININLLITDLIEEMSPLSNQKGLELGFHPLEHDVNLLSDAVRIKQIIKNLLSNAIKFTDKGKVDVTLEENANDITIKVIDEGIGISQDKLDNIFERFKQADGSTTRKYGGTGLGLAISKELSSLLGGDIKAFSKVDEGSTFELILPKKTNIQNVSDDTVRISNTPSEDVEVEEIVLFDMDDINLDEEAIKNESKILVINSDYAQFFSVAIALKKENIFLEYKDSIADAKKTLQASTFDMIVVDKDNSKACVDEFSDFCKQKDLKIIVLSKEQSENENYLKTEQINEQLFDKVLEYLGR